MVSGRGVYQLERIERVEWKDERNGANGRKARKMRSEERSKPQGESARCYLVLAVLDSKRWGPVLNCECLPSSTLKLTLIR